MEYGERIIDHYENPRHMGSLDKNSLDVGTGIVGAPACGDVMKLQIKVNEQGIIEDAKFKVFGCGSAIASSSVVADWIIGKTLEEAKTIRNSDIATYLDLPRIKVHCSVLAENVIKAAIADYYSKQDQNKADIKYVPQPMLTITPNAIRHIKNMLAQRQPKSLGIRVGIVRQEECKSCASGLTYIITYVDITNSKDEVINIEGIDFYIDSKIISIIFGTKIDYKDDNLQGEFIFTNPRERKRCGCGRSFELS